MGVPGSANFLLAAGAQGYQIERSLRFSSGDSSYLNRTPASAGNRKTWTWSGWVKRSKLGVDTVLFHAYDGSSSRRAQFLFNTSDQFVMNQGGGGTSAIGNTTAVFRDVSAWYHFVFYADYANTTFKLYVNNVEQTLSYSSSVINADGQINAAIAHQIGSVGGSSAYFEGYLTEINFIDGQALTPSSFGETNPATGVWQPKKYAGTYGTNGFYLNFKDNSNTTATTLGKDYSGNGNNWTPNNFSAASGSSSWSFSTQRENDYRDGTIISGITGFTSVSFSGTYNWGGNTGGGLYNNMILRNSSSGATIAETSVSGASGSWSLSATGLSTSTTYNLFIQASSSGGSYMERNSYGSFTTSYGGRASDTDSFIDTPTPYADGGNGRGNYCTLNPLANPNGSSVTIANGNLDFSHSSGTANQLTVIGTIGVNSGKWYYEYTVGSPQNDQIGISAGLIPGGSANGSTFILYYSGAINNSVGSISGTPASFTTGDVIGVAYDMGAATVYFYKNNSLQSTITSIGSFTAFAIRSVNTAVTGGAGTFNFGQRAFAYTPPSGFLALNTQNLPEPTIKKPSSYTDVKLYSGNGTSQTITGLGFNPDLVWIKERSSTSSHWLTDTVRGSNLILSSNSTGAETSGGSQCITAFNSDGFSVGNDSAFNENSQTYVAWCWDESATPGFDIVTYTGTGSATTVAHSLGVTPSMIITKRRDAAFNWVVWHTATGNVNPLPYVNLNTTLAVTYSDSSVMPGTATSTTFPVGTWSGINASGGTFVAYLWSEVAGFSKFGSYTGNGSTDGVFVHLGFRPALVITKQTNTTGDWIIQDSRRGTYNPDLGWLYPNLSYFEETGSSRYCDFLSNGFKIRNGGTGMNASGGTYIFAAWAESPFKYSLAR